MAAAVVAGRDVEVGVEAGRPGCVFFFGPILPSVLSLRHCSRSLATRCRRAHCSSADSGCSSVRFAGLIWNGPLPSSSFTRQRSDDGQNPSTKPALPLSSGLACRPCSRTRALIGMGGVAARLEGCMYKCDCACRKGREKSTIP